MSVRGFTRLATCNTIPRSSVGRLPSYKVGLRPSWYIVENPPLTSIWSIRGAKTKSVIKAQDLPQGPLPPLSNDETNDVPAKSYGDTLQQYLNNMRKFPDCVLLMRVGDFYELYFDHVPQYAPLLNIKQTKKRTVLGPVPMSGFQYAQLDKYLKILVLDHDLQVAIADQVAVTASGDRMKFDRPVARIVTKGTLIAESFLPASENSYLLAIHLDAPVSGHTNAAGVDAHERYSRTTKVGLSWVDLSSGDFFVQTSDLMSLPSIIAQIAPKEIVLDSSLQGLPGRELQRILGEGTYVPQYHTARQSHPSSVSEWMDMLERPVPDNEAANFTRHDLAAGNIVLDYAKERLLDTPLKLQPPVKRSHDESMMIDKQSLRGLEIKSLLRDGTFKGCLLHAIRKTVTSSGARLLSQRIVSPSMSLSIINNRLDLVQQMLDHRALREDVQALLVRTKDTVRLVQKFSSNKGDADDLLELAETVEVTSEMTEVVHEHILAKQDDGESQDSTLTCLWDVLDRLDLDGPRKLAKAILNAIDEEGLTRQQAIDAGDQEDAKEMAEDVIEADAAGETTPRLARRESKTKDVDSSELGSEDIWIMRSSASTALKRLHQDREELLKARQELRARLRQELKIPSLKLEWKSNLEHYCQVKGKDTRVDLAHRGFTNVGSTKTTRSFHHPEWTELGGQIDSCKLRIRMEEERVLGTLRRQVLENIMKLRRNAAVLDEMDVACSSALVAKERNLIRPKLNHGTIHRIVGGRHPTVDVGLTENGRRFTANDCSVGDEEQIYLITGPNMAGKSTYLRQNALITILAQTGCFVPADYAELGLVDKIFSRVGSADNLYQDQSTFMVEMQETAEILQHATNKSFVIMDEVGRGTTPEDGVAVGYACLHHLHNVNRCRTLFATHFHVLAEMTAGFERLRCYCTDVAEEKDGSWVYVHRLRRGVNKESHALKVARLAGLPDEAIAVAADVLARFHQSGKQGGGEGEPMLKRASG